MPFFTYTLLVLISLLEIIVVTNANALDNHNNSAIFLYQKYCAPCHGSKGDGQTPAAAGMSPPPPNFTLPTARVNLTRERMIHSIQNGRPNTAMTTWGDILSTEQTAQIVDYIQENLMPSSHSTDTNPGRHIYTQHCSVCHGDKGDTARWARKGLTPQPRNFTKTQAQHDLTRPRMIFSVTYGRPESAMPAWKERLNQQEIEQVVDYIRQTFLYSEGHGPQALLANLDLSTPSSDDTESYKRADMRLPLPNKLIGDPSWGADFYLKWCLACHGKEGDGRGPRSEFIQPKPRNFTHPAAQHQLNRPNIFERISMGERGTNMPAWNQVLTEQQIANLAEYIFQTFIQPGLSKDLLSVRKTTKPLQTKNSQQTNSENSSP
ncbi:MAG: c-type cytochrome [Magnetococcus sp. DMHC-6]